MEKLTKHQLEVLRREDRQAFNSYVLLGHDLYYKCKNLILIKPSEIQERVLFLQQKGAPQMTPQVLIQECRLNGEKTMAKINTMKRNIPIIIERLRRRNLTIEEASEYQNQIEEFSKTPFYNGLPEGEKRMYLQLYRDLDSQSERQARNVFEPDLWMLKEFQPRGRL